MTKNAYIHIPFCKSKCNYCSFVSFPELELMSQYLDALVAQIKSEYKGEKLNTLYFGGGTPSVLSIAEFKSLLALFNFEPDAEITIEVNPDSVDLAYLQGLKKLGVNRISIGSQTFDDNILKLIGRRHDSQQIKSALMMAKDAGFENISLDFIYGLPTQTIGGFEQDLKTAVSLGIQHISLYGLKIEEGCYFYTNEPSEVADSDLQADMYLSAIEILTKNGFEHYEVSNFSIPSFNSRHNLCYWDNNAYYGFGCSASAYIDGIRYTNESKLECFIKNPIKKNATIKLTGRQILEEEIFLGFRKIAGLDVNKINSKYSIDFYNKYQHILEKYIDLGLIKETKCGVALTNNGILLSNDVLCEFLQE